MYAQTKQKAKRDHRQDQQIASKSVELKPMRLSDVGRHIVVRAAGSGIVIGIINIPVFIAREITPMWEGVKSDLVSTSVVRESPELASHFPYYSPSTSESPFISIRRATEGVAPSAKAGVVKLARHFASDSHFPFTDLERNFMDFGFNKYDVGFQSLNLEAAKPMVHMTTVLPLVIVVVLNLAALIITRPAKESAI